LSARININVPSFGLFSIYSRLLSVCYTIVVRLLFDCCSISKRRSNEHETVFNRTKMEDRQKVNLG